MSKKISVDSAELAGLRLQQRRWPWIVLSTNFAGKHEIWSRQKPLFAASARLALPASPTSIQVSICG